MDDQEGRARRLFIKIDAHNLGAPYLEALIAIVLGPGAVERHYASDLDNADLALLSTALPSQRIQAAKEVLHAHGIAITDPA